VSGERGLHPPPRHHDRYIYYYIYGCPLKYSAKTNTHSTLPTVS